MRHTKYKRMAAEIVLKHGIHLSRSKEFNELLPYEQSAVRNEAFKILNNATIS